MSADAQPGRVDDSRQQETRQEGGPKGEGAGYSDRDDGEWSC